MEHEAAKPVNWAYLDGKVSFGRHWWDLVRQLAQEEGYDDTEQIWISNMITRYSLPPDLDIAIGLLREGKPQIMGSTVDRNHVFDTVLQAAQGQFPNDQDDASGDLGTNLLTI